MKYSRLFAVPLLTAAIVVLFVTFSANGVGSYTQLPTISIPGNLASGFDISWVDAVSGRYYLADRTTGSVEVVDAVQGTYLYSIKGFVGNGSSGKAGPDGILTLGNELWAGDGDSTVKVVDLTAGAAAVPVAIKTGGNFRADELAYDPRDGIILIANDVDSPPFVSFISQQTRKVLAKLPYPQSTGGLEQSVWEPVANKFYMSVPSTLDHPLGEIDELDPITFTVTNVIPTQCKGPAGLALLPGRRLITSCGSVVDAPSGARLYNVVNPSDGTPVSGDEIWYNPGDDRVYFGSNNVAVVDASTYRLIQVSGAAVFEGSNTAFVNNNFYQVVAYLFPYPIPSPAPIGVTFGGHSVAANSANNHIFVPVTGVGVKVFVPSM